MPGKYRERFDRIREQLNGAVTKVSDAGGLMRSASSAARILRREGLRGAVRRISGMAQDATRYQQWVAAYDSSDDASYERLRHELEDSAITTLISVVVAPFNKTSKC